MFAVYSDEIMIPAAGRSIHALITAPETDEPRPAVILSHGYNGCCTDFPAESRALAEHGYIAVCIDFCGGSTRSRSTGVSTEMSILTEKADLLAVIDHVRSMPGVDAQRLFLLGGSQGGLVTALAAEERPDVRGVALYFPAFCIPQQWNARYPADEDVPETVEFWGLTLGARFVRDLRGLDSYAAVGGYQGPVLILQGDKDPIVTVESSEKAQARYPNAELVILPGEAHGFSTEGVDEAVRRILPLFDAAL